MGRLIVFEGLDGCGKSTQIALAREGLERAGHTIRQIKLPDYESRSSELVKMYLAGEFGGSAGDVNAYAASSFYAVDRFASFNMDWKKDYESETLILADRYTTSNPTYQLPKLPKEEWDAYLDWLEEYEYEKLGLPRPDVTIFLDMPIAISQRLMTERYSGDESKKDVHESNVKFLNDCREAALYTANRWNYIIIPCSEGDAPRSIESISADIAEVLSKCTQND
ncbi:MAG: thymidylate kinase [Clostridia bacterium]|nr:thymidylate kinase [Clostridia bacterium]